MSTIGPFNFQGGYCPGYDFTTLPQGKGYVTTMENVKIANGSAAPRWGRCNVNNTNFASAVVNGLTPWIDTVNSKYVFVAICNSKILIADGTSYTPAASGVIAFTDRTGAVAASSLSGLVTFDSLNNILVGSSNSASSGVLFKVTAYNANGAVLAGTPPSADIVKQCNNFMFASRNLSASTTQSNVYWSNVNDPETWTAANVLAFNKNDGEPIMALGSIGTDLYIFKKTSVGRLSTVTITTSGAVTLGPLVTVIRGVGCCGPRALDNLPNGNIVFLSTTGHLYEFDGSSLVDLSRKPGEVDAYSNGTRYSGSHDNYGLSSCAPNVNSSVKVARGINEIWTTFTTSILDTTTGPQTFVYNFEYGRWQGSILKALTDPLNRTVYTLSSFIPFSGISIQESAECFLWGDAKGNVWASGDFDTPFPADRINVGGSLLTTFSIGTTIQLSGDADKFIPRSICFEVTNPPQGSVAGLAALSLYSDFDVYTPDTTTTVKRIYTGSGVLPARVFANIPFTQDSVGTNIFPTFISLLWTGTGPALGSSTAVQDIVHIGKFWLSDEIIR